MINHPFPPLYDENSRVLILGSFPSVKSREQMFFYGHPQNRFWRVTAAVFNEDTPKTVGEKKAFLHRNRIALWDVIASCDIAGSSDGSIKNAAPNDISVILRSADIKAVFTNGRTAQGYYDRYILSQTGVKSVCLPSTSPANAAQNFGRLVDAWKIIGEI